MSSDNINCTKDAELDCPINQECGISEEYGTVILCSEFGLRRRRNKMENRDCKGYLARMIMVKFTNHFKDNKNMTQDDFWRLQKEMIDEEKHSDSNAKVNQSKKNEGKQGGTQ